MSQTVSAKYTACATLRAQRFVIATRLFHPGDLAGSFCAFLEPYRHAADKK
jgi:hypothetical protein